MFMVKNLVGVTKGRQNSFMAQELNRKLNKTITKPPLSLSLKKVFCFKKKKA